VISGLEAALWGLLGGACVELLEFAGALRRTGRWPWRVKGEPGPAALFVSVVIRVGVGAAVTAALGASDQINTALAAFAAGVGAPLLIEQMARQLPRSRTPAESPATEGAENAATEGPAAESASGRVDAG
jgi:hypothetical protein